MRQSDSHMRGNPSGIAGAYCGFALLVLIAACPDGLAASNPVPNIPPADPWGDWAKVRQSLKLEQVHLPSVPLRWRFGEKSRKFDMRAGVVYTLSTEQKLTAIDGSSGEVIWQREGIVDFVVADGAIVAHLLASNAAPTFQRRNDARAKIAFLDFADGREFEVVELRRGPRRLVFLSGSPLAIVLAPHRGDCGPPILVLMDSSSGVVTKRRRLRLDRLRDTVTLGGLFVANGGRDQPTTAFSLSNAKTQWTSGKVWAHGVTPFLQHDQLILTQDYGHAGVPTVAISVATGAHTELPPIEAAKKYSGFRVLRSGLGLAVGGENSQIRLVRFDSSAGTTFWDTTIPLYPAGVLLDGNDLHLFRGRLLASLDWSTGRHRRLRWGYGHDFPSIDVDAPQDCRLVGESLAVCRVAETLAAVELTAASPPVFALQSAADLLRGAARSLENTRRDLMLRWKDDEYLAAGLVRRLELDSRTKEEFRYAVDSLHQLSLEAPISALVKWRLAESILPSEVPGVGPLPIRTAIARKARIEGFVILTADVDPESGEPVDIVVAKTLPLGLDNMARNAFLKWRFEPTRELNRVFAAFYFGRDDPEEAAGVALLGCGTEISREYCNKVHEFFAGTGSSR